MKVVIDKSKCIYPDCQDEDENEPCWIACPEKGEDERRAIDICFTEDRAGPEIYYNQEEAEFSCSRVCDSCGNCIPACPNGAIIQEKTKKKEKKHG